jgi:2-amino-4-hydroxy-6-hydroxymethyldihydropteridine diphosphokinase
MRDIAYVALGSNLGDRTRNLALGRKGIAELPDTRVLAATTPEETEPLPGGPPGQERYLNQMLAIETTLPPHDLLAALLDIERRAGRVRRERWGARTLDLDIVAFDRQAVRDEVLVVPHPGLGERDFWQRELDELRGVVR